MSESNNNKANRLMNVYFRMDSPKPYQVTTKGNIVYSRWSTDNDSEIFILRVSTTENNTETVNETTITTEYTIARWSDREIANYSYITDFE